MIAGVSPDTTGIQTPEDPARPSPTYNPLLLRIRLGPPARW